MADKLNTNVFDENKKFVDFAGLDYFWDKAKAYIDGVDTAMDGKVTAMDGRVSNLETTVGDTNSGLVKDVATNTGAIKSIQEELESLSGGAGSISTQINNAIAALDLPNTYEAKGEAAKAQAAAEAYADGLATNYDAAGAADAALAAAKADAANLYQVKGEYEAAGAADAVQSDLDTHKADTIAHVTAEERTAWNAAKSAIDAFLADADMTTDAVDTLKELQEYMTTDGEAATELVNRVAALETADTTIRGEFAAADTALASSLQSYADQAEADALAAAQAYADGLVKDSEGKSLFDAAGSATTAEQNAKDYTDEEISKLSFDEAGAAAQALADAKADAAEKYQVKGSYEAAGAAAQALTDAQAYADGLVKDSEGKSLFDAAGSAAAAQAAAIAQAKVDAAEALKSYYTKTEVDNLLSTNSTGDRAYAKQYTDELFGSIKFAASSDIDKLFA